MRRMPIGANSGCRRRSLRSRERPHALPRTQSPLAWRWRLLHGPAVAIALLLLCGCSEPETETVQLKADCVLVRQEFRISSETALRVRDLILPVQGKDGADRGPLTDAEVAAIEREWRRDVESYDAKEKSVESAEVSRRGDDGCALRAVVRGRELSGRIPSYRRGVVSAWHVRWSSLRRLDDRRWEFRRAGALGATSGSAMLARAHLGSAARGRDSGSYELRVIVPGRIVRASPEGAIAEGTWSWRSRGPIADEGDGAKFEVRIEFEPSVELKEFESGPDAAGHTGSR